MTVTCTLLSEKAQAWIQHPSKASYIDGGFIDGRGQPKCPVIDPATGEMLCRLSMGDASTVDQAVQAAERAYPSWRQTSARERAALLRKLADAMEADAGTLAQIEAVDVGKALVNAEGFDIPFGIESLRYFAGLAESIETDTRLDVQGFDARVHLSPYGVCGFIFPWNFPFDLLMWGLGPALAAGNTVVVKPSEVTPLSTLYVAEMATAVGFPDGVINIVTGDGPNAGAALPHHPLVRRMSFTGSPEVGRLVGAACGARMVPCKLELGGKGAAVILDDADIQAAAEGLAGALTLNTGQVCCTATRWIVHEAIADEFAAAVTAALQDVVIGPGLDRQTQMGPLVSQAQYDRVLSYLERGLAEGATAILRGGAVTAEASGGEAASGGGYFVGPTILTGGMDNVCFREEVFGPFAYMTKVACEQEAIEQVNALDYGLANSVWSRDIDRANRVAERLVAGNNWINAHNLFAYGLPYGGVNRSGMGGGVNSSATFYDYLRPMTIARPV